MGRFEGGSCKQPPEGLPPSINKLQTLRLGPCSAHLSEAERVLSGAEVQVQGLVKEQGTYPVQSPLRTP
jgi:hypothetical protein